jgi:serine/threonine-protein kinase
LKNRPALRVALQVMWALFVVYVLYILVQGGTIYADKIVSNSNIFIQIAQIGLNLFTFSTIDIVSDIYILLGYFGLAVVLFIHRSDDWLAIFLSLMVMAFGMRVTNIGNELALNSTLQFWVSPIMMMGDAGIILFGWLYPDGRFLPRWAKYFLPVMLVNVFLFYWPSSPLFVLNLNPGVYLGVSLFWYLTSAAAINYRYRTTSNPLQKQQIRWVLTGLIGPLLWFILFNVLAGFVPAFHDTGSSSYAVFQIASRVFGVVLFLAFPLCLTIAIARYKLFDIDLIINRALVYGALTVAVVSLFGLLLILDNVLLNMFLEGQHTTIVMMLSAIAAGALFQPTRKALQRFVDRTLYHINIDYLKTPPDVKATTPWVSDTVTKAPTLFSGYRNLALIGKGGMAEVYRADDTTQKRTVAIKVLLSNLAEDAQFRKRFQRESQTLAELDHPNIVRLYDYGVENDLYFMVMEYLNGLNLSAFLKEKGQFQLEELMPILQDISHALDYAHQAGLVHRDIKPSNVMLDSSREASRAVLTDFGIAKFSRALTNITASSVLGTFDYIAPEQIEASTNVDGRADIYALGVMTYQLLTGALPFHRPSTGAILLAHMTAPPPDAREVVPALSRHTAQALQKAMAKVPAERFASAGEFVLALA